MEHINFSEKRKFKFEINHLIIIIVVSLFTLTSILFTLVQTQRIKTIQKEIDALDSNLISLQDSIIVAQSVIAMAEVNILNNIINEFKNRKLFSNYIEAAALTPPGVWLAQLKIDSAQITIQGEFIDSKDVVTYLSKLKESKLFKNINLRSTKRDKTQDKERLIFIIECVI